MGTTINNPVQNHFPLGNQYITQKETSRSTEKDTGHPNQATAASDTQVSNVDNLNVKEDRVEIRRHHYNLKESEQAQPENDIEDIDKAMEMVQGIREMVSSENKASQIEQIHNVNRQHLVEILS